jgi:hypothetical protein
MSDREKAPAAPQGTRKTPPEGRKWVKGVSGNPGGRPKTKELEQYAREQGTAAIDRLLEIGRHGRGVSAVRALELVLAYGYGRPKHQVAITTSGTPLDGRFAGAAARLLEAAIERAEAGATDPQTVAQAVSAPENASNGAVIDVHIEPAAPERGQPMAVLPAIGPEGDTP